MKKLIVLICAFFSICCIYSQKYIRPVFDRTDNYLFHIDSVEVTKDSTFLFFTYDAEGGSWANISDNTRIIDKKSGREYKAISVQGIPFQPAKRHFTYSSRISVRVSFASIGTMSRFDFIEEERDSTAFNIYGIDLSEEFPKSYSIDEEERLANQADFFSSINDSLALLLREQELDAKRFLYGNKSERVIMSLSNLAILYHQTGHYEKAIEIGFSILKIIEQLLGKDNKVYAAVLKQVAGYYQENGDFEKAIQLYKKAADVLSNINCVNEELYYLTKYLLSYVYDKTDSVNQAITTIKEVIVLQRKNLGDNDSRTRRSWYDLAIYLRKDGKLDEAMTIWERLIEQANEEDKQKDIYVESLTALASSYYSLKKYASALQFAEKASEIYRDVYGVGSLEYANALKHLSTITIDSIVDKDTVTTLRTNNSELHENNNESANHKKEAFQSSDNEYIIRIRDLYKEFTNYRSDRSYEKAYEYALSLCNSIASIPDSIFNDNILEIAKLMRDVPDSFNKVGDFKGAIEINNFIYQTFLYCWGPHNKETLYALLQFSVFYSELYEFDKSISVCKKVIDYSKDNLIEYGLFAAAAYRLLSAYYITIDAEMALKYEITSSSIWEKYYDENSPELILSWFNIGICMCYLGNIEGGTAKMEESLSLMRESKDTHPYSLIMLLYKLSEIYHATGDYLKAIALMKEVIDLQELYSGNNNIHLTTHIRALMADCYMKIDDEDKAYQMAYETTLEYMQYVNNKLPAMNSREKELCLNGGSFHEWFDITLPLITHHYKENQQFTELLYYSSIFRKGLLMNLERASQVFIEHKDKESGALDYSWKSVCGAMNSDDLVINFFSFPSEFDSSLSQYAAIMKKASDDVPKYVPLFVDSTQNSICVSDSFIYNKVWKPLINYVEGAHTIYMLPSTAFNNIGIEYVKDDSNRYYHERYNIYRISSILELASREPHAYEKNAVLYGGLEYDKKTQEGKGLKKRFDLTERIRLPHGLRNVMNARGGFEYLGNTLEEVQIINESLTRNGFKTQLFTSHEGTEESFKALSGNNVDIIHLSTHGLFIKNDEVQKQKAINNLSFLIGNDWESLEMAKEDDILSRSFLVMSNGNMLIVRDSIAQDIEDGFLTATEIAQMDLHKVDLVVLSACQTAQGEINNEGVYGLQRGFKKAGVNTILMSLHQVDDEATKILMVEFYKNLMSGKSKLQSLKDAQKYLRQVEDGKYDDPKYWASFIMLDGIN